MPIIFSIQVLDAITNVLSPLDFINGQRFTRMTHAFSELNSKSRLFPFIFQIWFNKLQQLQASFSSSHILIVGSLTHYVSRSIGVQTYGAAKFGFNLIKHGAVIVANFNLRNIENLLSPSMPRHTNISLTVDKTREILGIKHVLSDGHTRIKGDRGCD